MPQSYRKVFDIKYEDVGSVSAFIDDKSLRDVMCRQVKFLKTMSLEVGSFGDGLRKSD